MIFVFLPKFMNPLLSMVLDWAFLVLFTRFRPELTGSSDFSFMILIEIFPNVVHSFSSTSVRKLDREHLLMV